MVHGLCSYLWTQRWHVQAQPRGDKFLRAIKILSMTSLRGEVRQSVLCCRLMACKRTQQSVKEMFHRQKFSIHVSQSPSFTVWYNCQRTLVDRLGKVINCAKGSGLAALITSPRSPFTQSRNLMTRRPRPDLGLLRHCSSILFK
jgi:hypothetical protein